MMNDQSTTKGKADAFLIVDLLASILKKAESPALAGEEIARELRALTGAKTVVLVQSSQSAEGVKYRVSATFPHRRSDLLSLEDIALFAKSLNGKQPLLLQQQDTNEHLEKVLGRTDVGTTLAVPLAVGSQELGFFLLLGIPEDEHGIPLVQNILEMLSTTFALILRNATLYDHQELVIEQRTKELKETNKALIEKARHNQVLLDAFPCVAYLMKPETHEIVALNQTSKNVGASIGQTCYVSWRKKSSPCSYCRAQEAFAANKPMSVEVEEDGVTWDSHWIPVPPDLLLHYAFDITEQKQLEEQLRQAQKMEAIGQLAGGVAHDFNNLLQAILGFADLLQEDVEDDEALESVEGILKASHRARELVSQLLAFSRRQVLEMKVVNINEVTVEPLKMIRRIIGEQISLNVQQGPHVGLVRADEGQIGQILMNLCANARDAMADGGTITISTKRTEVDSEFCKGHEGAVPGTYTRLSVSDTGTGMDDETIHHIYEPFFTTKDVGAGTGLGLSTVYGLVRQHQGLITVTSTVGKGTTFDVYLPTVNESVEKKKESQKNISGGNETILIAEDEKIVRDLTHKILTKAGYRVLTAVDGEETIEILKASADEIDLILVDVIMPKQSGKTVYNWIKNENLPIKVIFSSGYNLNAIHTNFIVNEGITLLQKPFARQLLLDKIREALKND